MDSDAWDQRYAAADLVWSAGPNQWVEQIAAGLPPGRALDLAAGEGRNALWLVEQGWTVTAVDFSQVALDRAEMLARARFEGAAPLRTVAADLRDYRPEAAAYDLVLLVYLQVPAGIRGPVVAAAADAVAPGGRLLVIAHDSANLRDGVGGPQDPAVLYTAADVTDDLASTGLVVDRAETVRRGVDTPEGRRDALDALVLAHRREAHPS